MVAACTTPADARRESLTVPVSHQMPPDIVPMLFPATGAQTRWTQGLDAFLRTVGYVSTRHCLRSDSKTVRDIPPPMFVRFFDIPDLPYLEAHGFSGGRVPLPATRQGCVAMGLDMVQGVRASISPLQAQWFHQVSDLVSDPRVVASYQGFSRCMAARRIGVRDENEFFALVDSRLQKGGSHSAPVKHRLAADYGTCAKPVEAVREPI